eukprot:CAMPEP_0206145632 /NCGR_PEP_ID=MMETSP1473-20131121/28031_1 /ASSEMBLY_ACC=CAM_ASM_001109 /TAXON_ID=1461547 /ORGANISM="Stichococcus sp, Strain RCC1054" /LENGTH=99 /DNA_ID=CAMNT_0053541909 /DNA_START=380 /DNA_END=675 /DNA_ORIENTATION=+
MIPGDLKSAGAHMDARMFVAALERLGQIGNVAHGVALGFRPVGGNVIVHASQVYHSELLQLSHPVQGSRHLKGAIVGDIHADKGGACGEVRHLPQLVIP